MFCHTTIISGDMGGTCYIIQKIGKNNERIQIIWRRMEKGDDEIHKRGTNQHAKTQRGVVKRGKASVLS